MTNVETEAVEADVMVMAVPLSELNVINSVQEDVQLRADVEVFPNPANEFTNVRINSVTPGELSVSVYTIAGEQLLSSTSPDSSGSWVVSIPTSEMSAGAYLLVIEQEGATIARTLNVLH